MTMFSELGELKHLTPSANEVQKKISVLQKFITDNYYVCTNEILSGLGEMYVYDERFKNNIDKSGVDCCGCFNFFILKWLRQSLKEWFCHSTVTFFCYNIKKEKVEIVYG